MLSFTIVRIHQYQNDLYNKNLIKSMVPTGVMFPGGVCSQKLLLGPAGLLTSEQYRTVNEQTKSGLPSVPGRYSSRQGNGRSY